MEKIGKYKIIEKIGEGGMGVVYKALDPLLDRLVALKTISAHLDSEPELRARFFREGRSAAQLSHRNIITVYDLGEDSGIAYMAMEYLDGSDLKSRIRSRDIVSLESKLGIMIEICEGLAHAHSRHVIHRDIKPGNIFLTSAGQVKILDFGLARMVTSEITRSGSVPGTPSYMSPEQVKGEHVDHRTDVFSAGALAYELFAGRKPFEGESITATIAKILHHDPEPLDQSDPSIDPEISAIVTKALAKSPDERYDTAADMLQSMKTFYARRFGSPAYGTPLPDLLDLSPSAQRIQHGPESPTLSGPSLKKQPVRAAESSPSPVADSRPRLQRRKILRPAALSLLVVMAAGFLWWAMRTISARRDANDQVPQKPASASQRDPSGGTGVTGSAVQSAAGAPPERTAEPEPAALPKVPADPAPRAPAGAIPAADDPSAALAREKQRTRSFLQAGRYEEAAAGLKEVLRLAPSDPEAIRMAQQLSALQMKEVADEALSRMTESRGKAEAAEARQFAAKSFEAAQGLEAEGRELYASGRFSDAASRFFSAGGIYSSCSAEAESSKAAQSNRAQQREEDKRKETLRGQAELSRKAYDQENREATKAEAETGASQKYRDASRMAADAQSKWDREDYAGAQRDFEQAAALMRQAAAEARSAPRSAEQAADTAPSKPVPPPAPQVTPPANDRQAVTALVQRYAACLQSRDMPALKSIWPGLSGQQERALLEEFRNSREIEVQVSGLDIKISGDSATATALRTYVIQVADGPRLETVSRTTFSFRRSAKTWLIEGIRFEPVR